MHSETLPINRHLPDTTSTVKLCAAELSPSLSVSVALQVLLPKALSAGVNVRLPAGLSFGAAPWLNRAVLLHATVKVTAWPGSSGPAETMVAQTLL